MRGSYSVLPLRVVAWPKALETLDGVQVWPAQPSLQAAAQAHRAELLLIDFSAEPEVALERLRELSGQLPVLVLADRAHFLPAMAAGAQGVLDRDAPPETIAAALRALSEGLAVFDRGFVRELVRPRVQSEEHELLTPREEQVLALLAEGLSNKEIAVRLEISEHTAKFHVNSILQKLGAQKRVEAVVRAAKLGIIEL